MLKFYFPAICIILLQVVPALPLISVGGQPDIIQNAPFLVQIYDKEGFSCGGTLIAKRFVVTAAHCVEHHIADELTIKAGASRLSDEGIKSGVSKIILPPDYDYYTGNMDVAVLELQTSIEGDLVSPAALCTKKWKHGTALKLYGWGVEHENETSPPEQMRSVDLRVIGERECRRLFLTEPVTETMLCATAEGKGPCYGDSGGPAIINNEFCGISSFSKGCAEKDYPGVFTSIFTTRSFIMKTIESENDN